MVQIYSLVLKFDQTPLIISFQRIDILKIPAGGNLYYICLYIYIGGPNKQWKIEQNWMATSRTPLLKIRSNTFMSASLRMYGSLQSALEVSYLTSEQKYA